MSCVLRSAASYRSLQKSIYLRRNPHQDGNEVCEYAEHDDPSYMVNGDIGEEVFDEDGVHVDWKAKEER